MRRAAPSVLLLLALAACQQNAELAAVPPTQDEAYECARESADGTASPRHRIVILQAAAPAAPAGTPLVLDVGDRTPQTLAPVGGAGGRLFANDRYAWRAGAPSGLDGAPGGVLTDVERIATYACVFSGRSGGEAPAGPHA